MYSKEDLKKWFSLMKERYSNSITKQNLISIEILILEDELSKIDKVLNTQKEDNMEKQYNVTFVNYRDKNINEALVLNTSQITLLKYLMGINAFKKGTAYTIHKKFFKELNNDWEEKLICKEGE